MNLMVNLTLFSVSLPSNLIALFDTLMGISSMNLIDTETIKSWLDNQAGISASYEENDIFKIMNFYSNLLKYFKR